MAAVLPVVPSAAASGRTGGGAVVDAASEVAGGGAAVDAASEVAASGAAASASTSNTAISRPVFTTSPNATLISRTVPE